MKKKFPATIYFLNSEFVHEGIVSEKTDNFAHGETFGEYILVRVLTVKQVVTRELEEIEQ